MKIDLNPMKLTLPTPFGDKPQPQLTQRKQDLDEENKELIDVINTKTEKEAEFQVDFEKKNKLSLNAVKAHLFGTSDEIDIEKPRNFQSRAQSQIEPGQKQRYEPVDMFSTSSPLQESTDTAKILPRFGLLPTEPQDPAQNTKKDEPIQFDLLNYRPDINVMQDMDQHLNVGREQAEEKKD